MEGKNVKELVRFGFRSHLIRITRETGFEVHVAETDEWEKAEVGSLIEGDAEMMVLAAIVNAVATLDVVEPDLGKEVFYASIRAPGMGRLGFWDATLN